jgi:hypothetical protein
MRGNRWTSIAHDAGTILLRPDDAGREQAIDLDQMCGFLVFLPLPSNKDGGVGGKRPSHCGVGCIDVEWQEAG